MSTTTYDQTAERLASQWTENTGAHMLDSGGAYGRNWERNQGKTAEDFLAAPEVTVEEYGGVYVNTFALLAKHLTYTARSEALTEAFREYVDSTPKGEAYYNAYHSVEEWLETLGLSEGDYESGNTYNWENLLDSVFQYVQFTYHGKTYVALSYHGGADVRGGYTDYVIYQGCEDWLWATGDATVDCKCGRYWTVRGMVDIEDEDGALIDYDLAKGCPACGNTELTGSVSECWDY